MSIPKSLYFVFPYYITGGVSLLFMRLAEYLAKTMPSYEIFLVDYENGFMAKNYDKSSGVKIAFYDEKKPIVLPDNALLIYQAMTPWSLFNSFQFKDETRIFFWNCHPFNLVPTLPGFRDLITHDRKRGKFLLNFLIPFKQICKKTLKLFLEKNSIAFVDGPNVSNSEIYLNEKICNPKFLPICLKSDQFVPSSPIKEIEDLLTFGWVGRIADFKFPILKYTLIKLDSIAENLDHQIIFKVVGVGSYRDQLNDLIQKDLKFIKVEVLDYIDPKQMTEFLQTLDLYFAMGTSALEGGASRVPTVLLDFSYGDIEGDYIFKPLFESQKFSVGDYISESHFQDNNDSLLKIIELLLSDRNMFGEKCYQYVAQRHDIESVAQKFKEIAFAGTLTYRDLRQSSLLKVPFAYKVLKQIRG